jgi:protein SCO1/2
MYTRVSRKEVNTQKEFSFAFSASLRAIKFLTLLLIVTCCSEKEATLPYYHTASFTPLWKDETKFAIDTLHVIAPFRFTDQDGKPVTNKTYQGKIYVANFFFTICPGICPKMTANLEKVTEKFKNTKDVLFISHSVTPDIDSVRQLKKYATDHNISSEQWHLVTGNNEEIYSLARQSYFAEEEIGIKLSSNEFLHTEHFILVDKQGHIRGIYKGTLELETERLIEDIEVLNRE